MSSKYKQKFLREHELDDEEEYFRVSVNKKNKSKERRYERALKRGDIELLSSYEDDDENA